MIGGRVGARRIAERFLDAGKPVFPVPFVPGRSDLVFQDIIERWLDRPVPGLTREQYLRLSLPWTGGAEPLTDLLLGALADAPDIFISYRRADAGWAAGRLHAELADALGEQRVFSDITHIPGGAEWRASIQAALDHARIGIVVAGNQWLVPDPVTQKPRLFDQDDTVRAEVRTLLERTKTVIVVLVDRPALQSSDLPEDLSRLKNRQSIFVSQENWRLAAPKVLSEVRAALHRERASPARS